MDRTMTHCGLEATLSLAVLGFGLISTVVLSIAVGTDYWLYTREPYDISTVPSASLVEGPPPGVGNGDTGVLGTGFGSLVTIVTMNSGLWRMCVAIDSGDPEEAREEPGETLPASCSNLGYFEQGFEKIEGADTSISILRGIRKATPVILLSLVLMVAAEVLSIVGYLRRDVKTLAGGVLFIVSALSLAIGLILYISAVNDEVSQWKKPENAVETQLLTYGYGWAFYAAGSSFLCAMTAAVGHITQYLSRYSESGDVRKMLIIVPGLSVKRLAEATKAASKDADPTAEKSSTAVQDASPSTAEHNYPADSWGGCGGSSASVSVVQHSRIATV